MSIAVDQPPAAGERRPLPIGATLAPGYTIVGHVRRGEDLDVYDVWSELRDCVCVAKTLRPDRLCSRSARRRLLHEGRLLIRLTHPHLVRAYELFPAPAPVLVLETLTGPTLSWMLARRTRRLPVSDVAYLGLHLCSAIGYLHRHGILHLDLKPSNIVAQHGTAKVLDLSIARPPGPGKRGLGTPQYMAPEQACGGVFSPATDVWGIGIVLFEALAGKRPATQTENASDDGRWDERPVDSVRAYRRVPAALGRIVERCLTPRPDARPAIPELAATLKSLV